MAKQKKEQEDGLGKLADSFGGELASRVTAVKYFIDTGNLAFNYICSGRFMGGGIPGGRITELMGPSSGGKSLWASNICRGVQALNGIACYLDCENSFNPEFAARACRLDPSKVLHFTPGKSGIESLEKVFLKIYNVVRAFRAKYPDRPLVFIIDSISAPPPERELRETDLPEDFTDTDWRKVVGAKEQPGERAKILSRELRKAETMLEKTNTTLLAISQIRQNVGVQYGSPEVTPGGKALEFYSCCRIRVSSHKRIEDKDLKLVIGSNLKVRNIKNRVFRPYTESEGIRLFFDIGVNPLSGLVSILRQAGRIETTGKGHFTVKEPWAGGESVSFRASLADNLMDAATLLKCPALIDAKTPEEVKAYLEIFGEAISRTDGGGIEEKEVTSQFLDGDGDPES